MNNETWTFQPIGLIHTPFTEQKGTPIQPIFSDGTTGEVEIYPPYREGLQDLDRFDRIWLLFGLDRSGPAHMRIVPFLDTQKRGLFATRSPNRPNAIGLSCVRLLSVSDTGFTIQDVDMLDQTPLFDIKPYVPRVDAFPDSSAGWVDQSTSSHTRADNRFTPDSKNATELGGPS